VDPVNKIVLGRAVALILLVLAAAFMFISLSYFVLPVTTTGDPSFDEVNAEDGRFFERMLIPSVALVIVSGLFYLFFDRRCYRVFIGRGE